MIFIRFGSISAFMAWLGCHECGSTSNLTLSEGSRLSATWPASTGTSVVMSTQATSISHTAHTINIVACTNHPAWKVVNMRGMPQKAVSVHLLVVLRDLHVDTDCALKGDYKEAHSWFEVTVHTGFKQGDVNPPWLIDAVIRCLKAVCWRAVQTATTSDQ